MCMSVNNFKLIHFFLSLCVCIHTHTHTHTHTYLGFPGGLVVKNPPANAGDSGDMGWEDSLEEEMATYSSIFAWKVP